MASNEAKIVEGSEAPCFTLPLDDGSIISLANMKGKTIVLYFYPKDETAGCTREAVEFTEAIKSFSRLGAVVIGISRDSVAKHKKFKEKHKLNILLGSDEVGLTIEAYGAWVEKTLYGRRYMGIDRSTFLIDPSGKVRKIWRKVKVQGHVEEVLAAAKTLKANQ